ncbi:MAG: short-chain dehydrogenase/reductase [Rhizobium sp.]|nr:short-chain dehydrogenase/reductase [Rhizobium sp.]
MSVLDRYGLSGRTAIVAGGARGMGRAIAELAASTGADIVILDILEAETKETAAYIASTYGRKTKGIVADLSDAARAEAAVDAAIAEFGRIDVLFNCTGIAPNTDVLDIPAAEWAQVMNVNVNAQFYVAQPVARHMAAQGGGSIVCIGSNSGFIVDRPQPQAHYNASKAAVHQMVKSLACELGTRNVRVNAVAPGFIVTEMTKRGMSNPEWMTTWTENTPMGRLGKPEEIANIMLFLASDASSFMTGSIVIADGGYTAW